MGFFNLYKPKEYGYRYIYYDPKKEARKEREKRLAAEKNEQNESGPIQSTLHKGYLREMAAKNKPDIHAQMRKSNIRLIIILIILFALLYFLIS